MHYRASATTVPLLTILISTDVSMLQTKRLALSTKVQEGEKDVKMRQNQVLTSQQYLWPQISWRFLNQTTDIL